MTYANRVLGSVPFGYVIGSPMTAAVEAQALAAQSSIEFIRQVGFDGNTNDQNSGTFGNVRQVTFSYETADDDAVAGTRSVSLTVPLLTIVPIPYLRIDDMTIDFTSKITEEMVRDTSTSSTTQADASLSASYKSFYSPVKVGFKASISHKHSSSAATSNRYKTEHTININVRAVQDDIPAGMNRVLDILESSIKQAGSAQTSP